MHLPTGNRLGAVRCAFWLVFRLLNAGRPAEPSGWIARIERLLCDPADDSPERGHLTYLTGFQAILSRDLQTAEADLGRSVQIAKRCGDLDLSTLARLALGRGARLLWRGLRWRPPSRRGDGRSQRRGCVADRCRRQLVCRYRRVPRRVRRTSLNRLAELLGPSGEQRRRSWAGSASSMR
jgi:hypothetical protein